MQQKQTNNKAEFNVFNITNDDFEKIFLKQVEEEFENLQNTKKNSEKLNQPVESTS